MQLERLDWRVVLTLATVSMLLQQAFSYVCQLAMPFLADRLAEEFGISRAWLGVYLSLQNIAAICAALGCGALIVKVGALRISQWCLLCMGASLFVTATGSLWLYPLGAILLGAASVSTPASSHILARFCPPRLAPLVFSIKQTGVPVGSLIAGVLFPALLGLGITIGFLDLDVELDAFATAFVVGLIVYAMAALLEPLRSHFDSDRKPDTGIDLAGVLRTMRHVVQTPELRDLSMVAFALGGLQSVWAGFFILFVIDGLDRSEIEAGTMFATASLTAIGARILWGWLGTALVSPRRILAALCAFATAAALLTALYQPDWAAWLILGVAILYNVTSLSWHGVLLAETARLAPAGMVGGVTGGVLAFTSVAMMLYPALYGGLLAITGSYGAGFAATALPALFTAFVLVLPPRQGSWFGLIARPARTRLRRPRAAAFGTVLLAVVALLVLFAILSAYS